jgi:3-deoxy-D-manno-octulosonate 8-phosphate phosphatase (KDO 8-P phosphatase)
MADFKEVNTFIFDVDGVLTDGSVQSYADGEHARRFYIKDGYALEKALHCGYNIIIISGGFEEGVKHRLAFLGIKDIYLGVKDKIEVYNSCIKSKNISTKNVLYMGDDIPDLKILRLVGLPTCPADASQDIKDVCSYISEFNGGRGAVRDVIEKVMRSQGQWKINEW